MPSKRNSRRTPPDAASRVSPWLQIVADPLSASAYLPPVHLEQDFVARKLESTFTLSTDATGFAGVRMLDTMSQFTGPLVSNAEGTGWSNGSTASHPEMDALSGSFVGYIPIAVAMKLEYVGPRDSSSGTLYGGTAVAGVSDTWIGPQTFDEVLRLPDGAMVAATESMVITSYAAGSRWCNVFNLNDSTGEISTAGGTIQQLTVAAQGFPASLPNCIRITAVFHVGLLPSPSIYQLARPLRPIEHKHLETVGNTAIALRPTAQSSRDYAQTAKDILTATGKALAGAEKFAEHWAPLITDAALIALPFL